MPTTSSGFPAQSLSRRSRSRIIRCRTAACARASWARRRRCASGWKSLPRSGVDLVLLQSSPQAEEMERFAAAGDAHGVEHPPKQTCPIQRVYSDEWARERRSSKPQTTLSPRTAQGIIAESSTAGTRRRVGRVAEGDGLLNRCTGKPVPGVRIPHSPPQVQSRSESPLGIRPQASGCPSIQASMFRTQSP